MLSSDSRPSYQSLNEQSPTRRSKINKVEAGNHEDNNLTDEKTRDGNKEVKPT